MKRCRGYLSVALLFLYMAESRGAEPQVSNVRAQQRAGTKLVDIFYDLAGDASTVRIHVSTNGGLAYDLPVVAFRGDGYDGSEFVSPGQNHVAVWDAGVDFRGQYSTNVTFCVAAAATPSAPPSDMVLLRPSGAPVFRMGVGDTAFDDPTDRWPEICVVHQPLYVSKYEVSNQEMAEVMQWAIDESKAFLNTAIREVSCPSSPPRTPLFHYGAAASQIELYAGRLRAVAGKEHYPCVGVNWYGVVAYCNFKSEIDGLSPCYDLGKWTCDFRQPGYRLPTEAEWEAGARKNTPVGDAVALFPWVTPATIDHDRSNYFSTNTLAYDVSSTRGHHPSYAGGAEPFTCPVNAFVPNDTGLFNMAGNAAEWCWDWYQVNYYDWVSHLAGQYRNVRYPTGPPRPSGQTAQRVVRGGSWNSTADWCDSTMRHKEPPSSEKPTIGFRTVRLPD